MSKYGDTDWCATCDCPIGVGPCDGCCAVAAAGDYDGFGDAETSCHYCGKDRYDWSDLGCAYCDVRHPDFGCTP